MEIDESMLFVYKEELKGLQNLADNGLFHVMRKSRKMHVLKVVSIKRKDENIS